MSSETDTELGFGLTERVNSDIIYHGEDLSRREVAMSKKKGKSNKPKRNPKTKVKKSSPKLKNPNVWRHQGR